MANKEIPQPHTLTCTLANSDGTVRNIPVPLDEIWRVLVLPHAKTPNLGEQQPDGSHLVKYAFNNTLNELAQSELYVRLTHQYGTDIISEIGSKRPDWMENTTKVESYANNPNYQHQKEAQGVLVEIKRTREMADDPEYQTMVREVFDEIERIGNITFVQTDNPSEAHMNIGHVPPHEAWMWKTKINYSGVATIPPNTNTSEMLVRQRDDKTKKHKTTRHEILHSLRYAHYSDYSDRGSEEKHSNCDTGIRDIGQNSVLSYQDTRDKFGAHDVKAIQSRYGVTTHPNPYVPPPELHVSWDIPKALMPLITKFENESNVVISAPQDTPLTFSEVAPLHYRLNNQYDLKLAEPIGSLSIRTTAKDDFVKTSAADITFHYVDGHDQVDMERGQLEIMTKFDKIIDHLRFDIKAKAGSTISFYNNSIEGRHAFGYGEQADAQFELILKDVDVNPRTPRGIQRDGRSDYTISFPDKPATKVNLVAGATMIVKDMDGDVIGTLSSPLLDANQDKPEQEIK